jgi:hypothetical protein
MAPKAFNTGKFSEKVLAIASYDGTLISDLYLNPTNKQKINRGAAFVIKNYFNEYMDLNARQNSRAYHHVYEFNKTGNRDSRLFKATVADTVDGAVLSFNFTQAKNPNKQGYPFPNKAEVMESGETIIITPKRGKYLKYSLEDGRFVTSTKSIVENPGGDYVRGSFEAAFKEFTKTQGLQVLQRFGFFKRIERGIIEKRRLVVPRINSGVVTNMIATAKKDADIIAQGVSTYYA